MLIKTYLLSSLLSFFLCFALCIIFIPILRRLKVGQNILSYVKEHEKKKGTPTMGGIAFVTAASVVFLIFSGGAVENLALLAMPLAFALVGLVDDSLKLLKRQNEGLKAYQKMLFQLCVAIILGVYLLKNGFTGLYIPFTQRVADIGIFIFPLSVFIIIASVNAVNLTDGLDGLASSSSIAFLLSLALIIMAQGVNGECALLCFILVGALSAFLVFNTNRASVFMGDTGSLALGGFIASVSLSSGNCLYIAIIGVLFVISCISVIVQVIYYKRTKKRVFLMAPVHHHFQKKGHSEAKISYVYFIITLLIGMLCLLFYI